MIIIIINVNLSQCRCCRHQIKLDVTMERYYIRHILNFDDPPDREQTTELRRSIARDSKTKLTFSQRFKCTIC